MAQEFRMTDIIYKTKHKIALTDAEIREMIRRVTAKEIPDYQITPWLMAVCFNGLTDTETASLTMAMRDSGQVMHWDLPGAVADKHSTGGVGDKTTLILAPICAACGIYMPKMSGRGLGHTGGTIDKLESIPGLTTQLAPERFLDIVKKIGFAVAMQSGNLAPADKILYKLRDVTETVDSIPLICASIMSKKLATGADHILLDVKVGNGAFMKTEADAAELARLMTEAAKADGRQCRAILTDMNQPLGTHIGNALEVKEAISVLHGDLNTDLGKLCIRLSAELLSMAYGKPEADCENMARKAVESGEALTRFAQMIEAQGGDPRVTEDTGLLPQARFTRTLTAEKSAVLTSVQCENIGRAAVLLGAGRSRAEDSIDPAAGIVLSCKPGDTVDAGAMLMTLCANEEALLDTAEQFIRTQDCLRFGETA